MVSEYVKSWLTKADEDLMLVGIMIREKSLFFNSICFHCQQSAEKYLKGFLAYKDLHTRKIHEILLLVEDCAKIDNSFEALKEPAIFLDQFYIKSRYPDDATQFFKEDAEKAHKFALEIKNFILSKIKV